MWNVTIMDPEGDEAEVNGLRWECWVPEDSDHSRWFFRSPDEKWLLKVEHVGPHECNQWAIEQLIWDDLSEDDRQHFSPILASGHNGSLGWVVTRFYDDLIPTTLKGKDNHTYDQWRLAEDMAERYNFTADWGPRQWKTRPDGSIVIHDYGVSPRKNQKDYQKLLDTRGPGV